MAWFSIKQIDIDTFAISEDKHWEQTHCYLLCGSKESLLIDSGLGVDDISAAVFTLTDKPVSVVATHAHFDHIGGHGGFAKRYVHKNEYEWLTVKNPTSDDYARRTIVLRPCDFPPSFNKADYRIYTGSASAIDGGHVFDLGNRQVRVINTPGHSPGHISFFEEDRGYLYAGDIAYKGILACQYPTSNPDLFFDSITALSKLKIKRLLPSHFELDVGADIINQITDGLSELKNDGRLKRGIGRQDFTNFKIYL